MFNNYYRLFVPVAVWRTGRGEVELQREIQIDPDAAAPLTVDDLRALIDTGQAFPAVRGSYCVQFGGGGKYFNSAGEALAYLCHRWRQSFILRHIDKAVDAAAARRPAAVAEARRLAEYWQNLEIREKGVRL